MISLSIKRRLPVFSGIFERAVTESALEPRHDEAAPFFSGSLQLRHVDAGSCNGCEVEIAQAFAPHNDAGRFGVRLVASPRHADGVLVTGVVTKNMKTPLLKTLDAVPRPRVVVACGDCAINGGVFGEGYGVVGPVGEVVEVDAEIHGCPPEPSDIIATLRGLGGR